MPQNSQGREAAMQAGPAAAQGLTYYPNQYIRTSSRHAPHGTTSPPAGFGSWRDRGLQGPSIISHHETERSGLRHEKEHSSTSSALTTATGRWNSHELTRPSEASSLRQTPRQVRRLSNGGSSPEEILITSVSFGKSEFEAKSIRESTNDKTVLERKGNGFTSKPNRQDYSTGAIGTRDRGFQQPHNLQLNNTRINNRELGASTRERRCFTRNCKCGIHHPPVDERGNIVLPTAMTPEQLKRQERCDEQLSKVVSAARAPYSGRPTESGQFLGRHPDYHHETRDLVYPDLVDTRELINGMRLPTADTMKSTSIERAQSISNSIDTLGLQIETPSPGMDVEILTDEDLHVLFLKNFKTLLRLLEEVHKDIPPHQRPFPKRALPEFVRRVLFGPRMVSPNNIMPQASLARNEASIGKNNQRGQILRPEALSFETRAINPVLDDNSQCVNCGNSNCACEANYEINSQVLQPQALRPEAPIYREGVDGTAQAKSPEQLHYRTVIFPDRNGELIEVRLATSPQTLSSYVSTGNTATGSSSRTSDCDCMWCEDGYQSLCLQEKPPRATKALQGETWSQDTSFRNLWDTDIDETSERNLRCAFCEKLFCWTCNAGVDSLEDAIEEESSGDEGDSRKEDDSSNQEEERQKDKRQFRNEGHRHLNYPSYLEDTEPSSRAKDNAQSLALEKRDETEEMTLTDYMKWLIDRHNNTHEAQLPRLPSSHSSADLTEDWTTAHLHIFTDSASLVLDHELETPPSSGGSAEGDKEKENIDSDLTQPTPTSIHLSYLSTPEYLIPRPTSPTSPTEHWDPSLPATTLRRPFQALSRPRTLKLDHDRVRKQTLQAVLCLLCIFEQDWEQYAEIYYSMLPLGDGWRQMHAGHMQDFYGEAWLGEHDRAYRLGSMSIKMERKVQIFGRPAWNVEHNYL